MISSLHNMLKFWQPHMRSTEVSVSCIFKCHILHLLGLVFKKCQVKLIESGVQIFCTLTNLWQSFSTNYWKVLQSLTVSVNMFYFCQFLFHVFWISYKVSINTHLGFLYLLEEWILLSYKMFFLSANNPCLEV